MKKIIISIILVATVLVAGIFAFMPLQKAQTIHTTILDTNIANVPATAATHCSANLNGNTLIATSNRDFVIHYEVSSLGGGMGVGEDEDIRITDGTNTFDMTLKKGNKVSGVLYYPGDTTVTISNTSAGSFSARGCATVITEGGGTASVT